MDDRVAERIAAALEQIALELAESNQAAGYQSAPFRAVSVAPVASAGPFPPIGGGRPPAPWVCPVHHTSKVVPAGVSQKTGRDYDAFTVCAERDCNEKPPRFAQPAPSRALPASEGVQGRELP